MRETKEINLFIASPGDVGEERTIVREICEDLNKSTLLRPYGISFSATGWEEAFPSAGRPQEIINKLVRECDLFVCIFHRRLGTPTGKEDSGTLEEFLLAYDLWKSLKKPHIMFYFKEVKIKSRKELEDLQLRKVLDLKEKIDNEKILLYAEFPSADAFREKLKDHLEKWIVEQSPGWPRTGETIPKATDDERLFEGYMKAALHEHRHLPTQGFETTLRVPIDLDRVYVNLHAHIHIQDFELTIEGRTRREELVTRESLPSMDIKAAFESAKRLGVKDLVILGDPGSGKTTLLKYILITLIQGKGEEKLGIGEKLVPFLAPLRELKKHQAEDLCGFVKRTCNLEGEGCSIPDAAFRSAMKEGRGIVLLDGLDEVADEKARVATCRWVDRARKDFPKTRFVVTSRFSGYQGESRLSGNHLELAIKDFTEDEVQEFLFRWFEAVETALHPGADEQYWKDKGRREAKGLFNRIINAEHLRKLAVNPLILQIIALVHRDRGTLPQRRVELYNECTNVLLEKWDMAKGLDVLLTAREARRLLQPVALWLHREEERRSAPLSDIVREITPALEEIGKAGIDVGALLNNIRDRSGIFMGYSSNEYGFSHLSFQEYLAAEEIRNRNLLDLLLDRLGQKWWREVVLLCLALDNPSVIEAFMKRIVKTKKFVNELPLILDTIGDSVIKPSAPFTAALRNRKLPPEARSAAVKVLAAIGGERVIQTLTEIVLGQDRVLGNTAYEGLQALGAAAGIAQPGVEALPPIVINPKDKSEMLLVPAGTFLYGSREDDKLASSDEKPQRLIDLPAFYIDKYPVTNELFAAFLNDARPSTNTLDKWLNLEGSYKSEKCRITRVGAFFGVEPSYERHPVIYVSWHGAQAYAEWSGKRLPTEAEWEKAARGIDGRVYPWGNEFDKKRCNTSESGIGKTTPVDRYPNGMSLYGCYDMAGNVWEWTDSWYGEEKEWRVLRGGSWIFYLDVARCAGRTGDIPYFTGNSIGFRCARTF